MNAAAAIVIAVGLVLFVVWAWGLSRISYRNGYTDGHSTGLAYGAMADALTDEEWDHLELLLAAQALPRTSDWRAAAVAALQTALARHRVVS